MKRDGLRVWFDQWEIKPGDSIPSKIEEGLKHSRVLVLCMSANAFGADWSQLESGTFRFRDPLNKDRRFIPLRLDEAPSIARSRVSFPSTGPGELEFCSRLNSLNTTAHFSISSWAALRDLRE